MVGILLETAGDRAGPAPMSRCWLALPAGVAANNLAWMLAEDGDYDAALRWAQVATDAIRERPEPHDTLGWIYLRRNQPVEALAAFERALDLAPQNRLYQEHRQAAKTALGKQ
jgi:tetratricopeptide (TPR) repeat protein